ncbi:hypothetical protein F5B20DRAFT_302763 [Whalleya microplaca]|nr:hypothetical protein F5B20DRAFT_302763 [Whalleya microplaca]
MSRSRGLSVTRWALWVSHVTLADARPATAFKPFSQGSRQPLHFKRDISWSPANQSIASHSSSAIYMRARAGLRPQRKSCRDLDRFHMPRPSYHGIGKSTNLAAITRFANLLWKVSDYFYPPYPQKAGFVRSPYCSAVSDHGNVVTDGVLLPSR